MLLRSFIVLLAACSSLSADNQTETISPIYSNDPIPFDISIELADFILPNGLHSYAQATHDGKWLIVAGRTNGLHGFNNDTNNFPPSAQNLLVYVIDPLHGTVYTKSLLDSTADLSSSIVDALSATSTESYQSGKILYVIGGYGIDSSTGNFNTKSTLTAIDVPGLMHWVVKPSKHETAKKHIRQTAHPLLTVTGGYLGQIDAHSPFLLIFGQNFTGYYFDGGNGNYTNQVRRLKIIDDGSHLNVAFLKSEEPNPSYRRRDLNIVPIIKKNKAHYDPGFLALSGVFTLSGGAWTVPVWITGDGSSSMPDPLDPSTFKQGMNNYTSASLVLYSKSENTNYIVLLGGMTFLTSPDGSSDPELPFTNFVTTLKVDSKGSIQQCLMDGSYPIIPSTFSNPGNTLLFGAGASFFAADEMPLYPNGVFSLDALQDGPSVLGYIVGGIASTLPNTNTQADSGGSPYVFRVILTPRGSN